MISNSILPPPRLQDRQEYKSLRCEYVNNILREISYSLRPQSLQSPPSPRFSSLRFPVPRLFRNFENSILNILSFPLVSPFRLSASSYHSFGALRVSREDFRKRTAQGPSRRDGPTISSSSAAQLRSYGGLTDTPTHRRGRAGMLRPTYYTQCPSTLASSLSFNSPFLNFSIASSTVPVAPT